MQEKFQRDIQLRNDGGAFCQATIPCVKNEIKINVSFCYLDFCSCCVGCIDKCDNAKETQQIIFSAQIKTHKNQFKRITLYESKPMKEQQIFQQQVRICNNKQGLIEIQLVNEESEELTQILAHSQHPIIFTVDSKFSYNKQEKQLYIQNEGKEGKKVKMLTNQRQWQLY